MFGLQNSSLGRRRQSFRQALFPHSWAPRPVACRFAVRAAPALHAYWDRRSFSRLTLTTRSLRSPSSVGAPCACLCPLPSPLHTGGPVPASATLGVASSADSQRATFPDVSPLSPRPEARSQPLGELAREPDRSRAPASRMMATVIRRISSTSAMTAPSWRVPNWRRYRRPAWNMTPPCAPGHHPVQGRLAALCPDGWVAAAGAGFRDLAHRCRGRQIRQDQGRARLVPARPPRARTAHHPRSGLLGAFRRRRQPADARFGALQWLGRFPQSGKFQQRRRFPQPLRDRLRQYHSRRRMSRRSSASHVPAIIQSRPAPSVLFSRPRPIWK